MMRSARAGTRDVLDRLTEWLLRPLRRATGHILVAPLYSLYTARLWLEVLAHPVPRHLAVILDGNRRFAERVGLDVRAGYAEGGGRVADVLRWSERAGIEATTLWALSVDNLERPADQVAALTRVIEDSVRALLPIARLRGWRLRAIGRRALLPASLQRMLDEAEAQTAAARRLVVQFAIGYGGREEILDALRRWADEPEVRDQNARAALRTLTAADLTRHLYAADLADPDLILRTSGEIRLSGFLLWQSVHAEFYFTDVLWPEFREIDFLRALRDYQRRSRRFGR
ncbi:MAG TPA: di-trans,poly-cis-decaprenylcistransferase [Chloroflexi bacterium]|nr:di-trans,poly-cis-decaprenylcistransferase [Chloroflexota bacterium]